jgi:FAD/FMN-containing dehydrogenase
MARTIQTGEQRFDELRARMRGAVLEPGDAAYDEARAGWNALIQRRPGAIARCADAADVVIAVNFARTNDVLLAVRSTGHDFAGNSVCDGGLVIDVSVMDEVHIDAAARRARVQPGATWGVFDRAAQAFGLASAGGTVSTVGVTGYTLGGGSGWLVRKHGLGADNLLAVEIVTADGSIIRADEHDNPDLFWAVRGAGANFGVVTSLEFRLHPVGPDIIAGQIIHPIENARDVLRFYRTFMAHAPEEIQCDAFFLTLPSLDVFPAAFHGRTVLDLVVAYAGDISSGEDALRPLRESGKAIFDGVQPMTYAALQQTFDAGMPKGNRWYTQAHYLAALSDHAIDTILAHVETLPGPFTVAYLEPLGGAVSRVDPAATAFPHRHAAYGFHTLPGWMDPAHDAQPIAWAKTFHRAMAPYSTGGVYVNLLAPDDGAERVRAAYGQNHERLVQLKQKWDPTNLFRMNHNVRRSG